MIHYQLRCDAAHEFDAWFRDSSTFDEQAKAGLLECPHCGVRRVSRALMAPAVPRRRRRRAEPASAEPKPDAPPPGTAVPPPVAVQPVALAGELLPREAPPRLPDQLRAALQRMRSEVEQRCEYVGPGFAAEARRIHDGESERRGIYGEATPDEAAALADDGIEVAQIPWLPRADA